MTADCQNEKCLDVRGQKLTIFFFFWKEKKLAGILASGKDISMIENVKNMYKL